MASLTKTTYQAFASARAQGNPAAVIVLPKPASGTQDGNGEFPYELFPPASKLQETATNIGLPMTAFALPLDPENESAKAHYAVRWFNPVNEAPLCGHATLALSQHLFSTLPNAPQTLRYLTRLHGIASASLNQSPFEDTKLVGIEFPELLDLPAVSKDSERWGELKGLFEAASGSKWEGTGEPVEVFEQDQYFMLEFSPELDLKALKFNASKLAPLNGFVYIFQVSTSPSEHIHTRVINCIGGNNHEDAATGSAHRAIIPHVLSNAETTARLKQHHPDFTGNTLRSLQQSKEGGELTVEWLRDTKTVRIMGNASRTDETTIEI
ncbi:phenazine biosynthesis [Fusarium tjaetaba]|uniref:Phenazine biosynthesis n=1 Tax=Fusarium tjaetaba TaxID=1567544 RepID=A0A8H5VZQ2_9HYPO|nr:phenazine biosynthesis [Fusarium tjaetaba]KAF5640098.1 phenazine biosynthesis [Fusarium tjaetaba]